MACKNCSGHDECIGFFVPLNDLMPLSHKTCIITQGKIITHVRWDNTWKKWEQEQESQIVALFQR